MADLNSSNQSKCFMVGEEEILQYIAIFLNPRNYKKICSHLMQTYSHKNFKYERRMSQFPSDILEYSKV